MIDGKPQKIPDDIIIKDLLRIKGENESYIEELESKIKLMEEDFERFKKGKPSLDYSKRLRTHQKNMEKRNKQINELLSDLGEVRRSNAKLREQLDKYDLNKFAEWIVKNSYADSDLIQEGGVEEYLKEIE